MVPGVKGLDAARRAADSRFSAATFLDLQSTLKRAPRAAWARVVNFITASAVKDFACFERGWAEMTKTPGDQSFETGSMIFVSPTSDRTPAAWVQGAKPFA